jgi:tetratricopeptide (TPR) repeat protein
LFQLIDFIRTGRHRVTRILGNAAASLVFVAILAALLLVAQFLRPRVYDLLTTMYAYLTTMNAPGRNLLIIIVLAIVLLLLPLRFWQAVKRAFGLRLKFILHERLKKAAEAASPVPSAPNPALRDTQGAIEDMRLAKSYLDDWKEKKDAPRSNLSFAARYLAQARAKDPDAKLVLDEGKDDPAIYTQDDLSADALFFEAQLHLRTGATKKELKQARDIIKKALAYTPYSVLYLSTLADVYLDLHDKPSALAAAQEALRLNPKSLDARKLLDRIEAAPHTQPPGFAQTNPDLIVILGILLVVGGGIAAVMSMFGKKTEGLSFILFVLGGAIWYYGRRMEDAKMFDRAYAEELRKRKS